jgi:hypothetical protein
MPVVTINARSKGGKPLGHFKGEIVSHNGTDHVELRSSSNSVHSQMFPIKPGVLPTIELDEPQEWQGFTPLGQSESS